MYLQQKVSISDALEITQVTINLKIDKDLKKINIEFSISSWLGSAHCMEGILRGPWTDPLPIFSKELFKDVVIK